MPSLTRTTRQGSRICMGNIHISLKKAKYLLSVSILTSHYEGYRTDLVRALCSLAVSCIETGCTGGPRIAFGWSWESCVVPFPSTTGPMEIQEQNPRAVTTVVHLGSSYISQLWLFRFLPLVRCPVLLLITIWVYALLPTWITTKVWSNVINIAIFQVINEYLTWCCTVG